VAGSGAQDLRDQKENCPMARLVGVDLPRDKRLEVALTYVYGVGRTRALETLQATEVSGDTRVHDLTDDQLVRLRDWIDANYKVEGDLRREVAADIRRKVEIGCYQGIRQGQEEDCGRQEEGREEVVRAQRSDHLRS
jgi:small subunit ribosomal protein S13